MIIQELMGETLINVKQVEDSQLIFECESGNRYLMYHDQDCCECVYLADICGTFERLYGSPLVMAEEVTNHSSTDGSSTTWTFYKLATANGYLTLRWIGTSNGYYSERVMVVNVNDYNEMYGENI